MSLDVTDYYNYSLPKPMIGGLEIFMFTSHVSMEDSKMSILPGRQVDYCVFLGGDMLFFPVHPGKFTVFEPEQKITL